jgi:5-methylcytosine-specific restriction endonuclease McrA
MGWQGRVYGRGSGGGVQRQDPKATTKKRIRASQLGRCLYCQLPIGARVKRHGRTVALTAHWDHFVPFAYLAQNPDANWVLSCQVCNGIKSDRIFQTVDEAREVILQARIAKGFESTAETVAKLQPRKVGKAKPKPKTKARRKLPAKPKPVIQRAPARRPLAERTLPQGAVSHSCGAWWTGDRRSHCPRCCQTFASEPLAALHRIGDDGDRRCLKPDEIGLLPSSQPWGTCWEKPKSVTTSQLRERIQALDVPPEPQLPVAEKDAEAGDLQSRDVDDPWRPTRPEKTHRRSGGLTPAQRVLADDLHARAVAIRSAYRGRISIHKAVELAATQIDLSGGVARAINARNAP